MSGRPDVACVAMRTPVPSGGNNSSSQDALVLIRPTSSCSGSCSSSSRIVSISYLKEPSLIKICCFKRPWNSKRLPCTRSGSSFGEKTIGRPLSEVALIAIPRQFSIPRLVGSRTPTSTDSSGEQRKSWPLPLSTSVPSTTCTDPARAKSWSLPLSTSVPSTTCTDPARA